MSDDTPSVGLTYSIDCGPYGFEVSDNAGLSVELVYYEWSIEEGTGSHGKARGNPVTIPSNEAPHVIHALERILEHQTRYPH